MALLLRHPVEFLISLNVLCLSKLSSKVLFFPTMILTTPIFLGEFYIQPRRGPKDGAHLHCEPETTTDIHEIYCGSIDSFIEQWFHWLEKRKIVLF